MVVVEIATLYSQMEASTSNASIMVPPKKQLSSSVKITAVQINQHLLVYNRQQWIISPMGRVETFTLLGIMG
jgi:hypothetical protein